MLDYDNTAFYYFSLTLLVLYLLPASFHIVAEFLRAFVFHDGVKARTSAEVEKAASIKKRNTGFARLNTLSYKTHLVCVILGWLLLAFLVSKVMQDGVVSSFDPYAILGIEVGATDKVIKKAYRTLSLKFHPDKNPHNKQAAEEMFMKVAKAYEALTDEVSKANFEKYGNPDGKQALEVSIGLPKFLLDSPKLVLAIYLVFMVVAVPSAVAYWYNGSKKLGEKNILYETYHGFYQLVKDDTTVENIPELLATSGEFRALNKNASEEKTALDKLQKDLNVEIRMGSVPEIKRGTLLLFAHLMRKTNLLSDIQKADLEQMLMRAPDLIDGLIDIAESRKLVSVSLEAIKFNQVLVQAIWKPYEFLLQLPGVTEKVAADIHKAHPEIENLRDFLAIPNEKKRGLDDLSEAQVAEVMKAASLIPLPHLLTKMYVDEEDDDTAPLPGFDVEVIEGDKIYEQDLITLRVNLRRQNTPCSGDKTNVPVHAPYFPLTLQENWWAMLMDKNLRPTGPGRKPEPVMHAFGKVADKGSEFKHEIRFMAPPREGEYALTLVLLCDSYLGLELRREIKFTVHSASELPEYAPHPEDVELDNEPTLFEQVMAANLDDDSDSDDSDADSDAGDAQAEDDEDEDEED